MATVALRTDHGTDQGERPRGVFGMLRHKGAYLRVLYLLLALPLAYVYLAIFTTLLFTFPLRESLSILTLPLIFLVVSPLAAAFERALARWLLGTRFTPMAPPLAPDVTLWDRLKAHLRNPVTWKSIAYLVLRVPLGVVVFLVTLALLIPPLLLILAPIFYAFAGGLAKLPWVRVTPLVMTWPVGSLIGYDAPRALAWLAANAPVTPRGVALSVLLTALGILLLIGALYALNGVAAGWGWFARQLLGVNPKDAQLAEAREVASEARGRAEQAEQGRRQLILDASHELRTPVATIRAHIDSLLLLQGDQLPESVRDFLAVTQREAERLSALVDDLLMLARADADGLHLDLRPVAVGEVVEEVYQALGPLAEHERQVTLVRTIAADLPPAYADRDRLAQVLLNLARNAITYTPAGGLVSLDLAAGQQPDTLALTVTDTGIGIPEDDLEHIFERFYRADASRARHTGGFGLGLSIVRDLVQAMGGTVVAERIPAGGSRFRVTLRAVPTPAPTSPRGM